MIDYKEMRKSIVVGLSEYIGVPVIRGNQTAEAPPYPYVSYNVTIAAGENNGTWQKHKDGIARLMVESTWSISALSEDWEESVSLATKAREWFQNSGHIWLSDHGITVQSTTQVTNRDNILTVEYERKNGFDVVFYVFDEAYLVDEGFIETAEVSRITEQEE